MLPRDVDEDREEEVSAKEDDDDSSEALSSSSASEIEWDDRGSECLDPGRLSTTSKVNFTLCSSFAMR